MRAASHDNSYFGNVDWMKCALLLANWRVNYDDCMFTDPSTIGGSTTAWGGSWNTGTPAGSGVRRGGPVEDWVYLYRI
ncbi:hypothetical protein FJT64_007152 [Amphibalanus amphitrite]|uniref:Uncharacterized protein n=1 Tax=Amphibalanus amphitrite TaxID=1232801 RepID=A0A6A4W0I5_AMPAM|nr:hypothetical protein FJT64_007152 [Amphibalanus amphitrite]